MPDIRPLFRILLIIVVIAVTNWIPGVWKRRKAHNTKVRSAESEPGKAHFSLSVYAYFFNVRKTLNVVARLVAAHSLPSNDIIWSRLGDCLQTEI
jgi:hypothetical protein